MSAEIINFPDGERLTPPDAGLRPGDHVRVWRTKVHAVVIAMNIKPHGRVLVQQTGGLRRQYLPHELERL